MLYFNLNATIIGFVSLEFALFIVYLMEEDIKCGYQGFKYKIEKIKRI